MRLGLASFPTHRASYATAQGENVGSSLKNIGNFGTAVWLFIRRNPVIKLVSCVGAGGHYTHTEFRKLGHLPEGDSQGL